MKLVDKGLKEVFEDNNITEFIPAYAYLSNSDCYSRLECMSNALYYFPEVNIQDYDLITYSNGRENKLGVKFHKLLNTKHMEGYIEFSLGVDGKDMEIHEDLYTEVVLIDEIHEYDYLFIVKEYKGIVSVKNVEEEGKCASVYPNLGNENIPQFRPSDTMIGRLGRFPLEAMEYETQTPTHNPWDGPIYGADEVIFRTLLSRGYDTSELRNLNISQYYELLAREGLR